MARRLRLHRPRSLRSKVFAVVIAVTVAPLLAVLALHGLEVVGGRLSSGTSSVSALGIAEFVRQGASPAQLARAVERTARERNELIAVLDPEGGTLASADHWIRHSWQSVAADLVYGPNRQQAQLAWERTRGPLFEREEVQRARRQGQSSDCTFLSTGNLYVCSSILRVPTPQGPVVVFAQRGSRAALQTLYGKRLQLLKLTLFGLLLGLPLAFWLTKRIVVPIESLHDQMLTRARLALPKQGSRLGRRDELEDLAQAFETVMTALEERSAANEVFLTNLAHEFKNPVAAIQAAAERLQDTRPAEDPARLTRLGEALGASSRRLEALLAELLELSRAEAGLPREPRERMDLRAHLQGLVLALKLDPRYPELTLDTRLGTEPLFLEAVPTRMEAAFRNLLENAASFAGAQGRVELEARAEGASVIVRVQDNGPGISPEHLPRMFERFFTTRGPARGTGLGLALVRAVVEAHGGRIQVSTSVGAGATFTVTLPRAGA